MLCYTSEKVKYAAENQSFNPNNPMQTTATANFLQSGDRPSGRDVKLLVLDIDGTIAGVSNQITDPVKQTIAAVQAQGIQVAIATGRMYRSALRFHQEIGSPLPLICYQGAYIKDPETDNLHYHAPLCQQIALDLLNDFEDPTVRSQLTVNCYIDDCLYVREITPASQAYSERTGVPAIAPEDLGELVTRCPPTKVLAMSQNTGLIDELLANAACRYTPQQVYLTKSHTTFFEAGNPEVNKGAAVRYLAEEMLGLHPTQVMTIGDNFNDLEMLQYGGISVAMGNAPAQVQAAATWVTSDVECDGVAAAIEEFLL
ncbi:Cof-type HAD-IIB family hydrolase [Phormidium sp. CCY1219]|uniref:Cof-type HAD-IIB family hydrolase n=1 Tax=Phormidium sp. CCY1219 TaxID=2886104 RepID=UPI002D7987EF|nr:Cof-type HAD-IIB family hydrolase [Phormidium sp. CCY1219]